MKRFSFRPALTMRGRKIRGLRGLSGKPFHPPLTDIPVGAYVIAPVLDLLSYFRGGSEWAPGLHQAAGYVYLVGAAVGIVTVLTGFADWLHTEAGTQIRRMANAHALLMLSMSGIVAANLVYQYFVSDSTTADLPAVIAAALILTLVIVGSTIGGSMVYDYGFNVETAQDNPVYHKSTTDILHPQEQPSD